MLHYFQNIFVIFTQIQESYKTYTLINVLFSCWQKYMFLKQKQKVFNFMLCQSILIEKSYNTYVLKFIILYITL